MTTLTIGQLARRVGLRASTLRYYEEQGLLVPEQRSASGYRLYGPDAEQTLRFIRRAQRLGFSLSDIRTILQGMEADELSSEAVLAIAERRFLALERRLTEHLVLHHEMESFLLELEERTTHPGGDSPGPFFEGVIGQVCADSPGRLPARSVMGWLIEQTRCSLETPAMQALLDTLRGRHVHIWQHNDAYHILVVGHDPQVVAALQALAALEAECQVHPAPQLREHGEGYLLTASGENAFVFARLFLALERE